MTRHSLASFLTLLLTSALLCAAVACLCLLVGSTSIGLPRHPDGSISLSLLRIRAEPVGLACLVGAALGCSGVVYQTVLRNPLADPYLLGVASGATLGRLLWLLPAWPLIPLLSAAGQHAAAFLGALSVIAIVFACSARNRRLEPVTLLLTGVVVSSLCSAALLLILTLSPDLLAGGGGGGSGGGAASVLVGGLQTSLSAAQVSLAAGLIAAGFLLLLLLSSPLAVALLTDDEAAAMGVPVVALRWAALLTASLVVAAAVSISGPIGFVGLICPHLARVLVGPDPRRLLPVATAAGAALLAIADAACRLLSQQELLSTVLPVGVITALLGGPFFLILLLRAKPPEET